MADKVTIVNRALSTLGANAITSLTDDTPEAQIANRFYEESRKTVLSEIPWTFALKRVLLNTTTDTLAWTVDEMNYVYVRPSDIIRIFGTNDTSANWKEEGEYIISDTSGLGIKYVYDFEDTNKFSASFVNAFADKLAADMCFSITNSRTNAADMLEKYESQTLPKATAENSQIGIPDQIDDNLWVNAKYGFTPVNSRGVRFA